MTEKIRQIIQHYKKNNLTKIKTDLLNLLSNAELKATAQALLALLFNEIYQEIPANIQPNQNYFLVIINGNVLNPGCESKKENILIYKNRIIATSSNIPDNIQVKADNTYIINAKGLIITPGLIDQHIHGGYECDFNKSSIEDMINLAKNLPQHGITSIVPTIMTASESIIKEQINKVKKAKEILPDNATRFLGIHLEGPYLSVKHKGIQPESEILPAVVENFKKIEDPEIKIVSYAPEEDKDFKLTRYLASKNIIPSAGHTSASAEIIKEASKLGLKQVTHLFNAMAPLHHRNPGIIGEALTNNNLYVEIIPDGLHLNPITIDIVLRTKPESKVIFISDSLPLNQANDDSIIFGNQQVFRKDNMAVNADGTLAGSLIFLNTAIKNLINWELADFSDCLRFTSLNAAENLNQKELGYIDKDKLADLVIWDTKKNYKINTTIINGQIAFKL
ncbi:MAG: N-acetylglucosamine-6-phosphate deacetylase [Candidatus Melainabacteria bacterium RIFOXYA12_FULL_32_12]|nr:MAG: N-acetylglucosamine-6-phosphate deacetylase [Candidatus Melainabacteria bacterium RIFOXYA2_FULL_32_9]OGI31364.1 MAG: N-acetylglucosamine-6-phosphate deacetylase [Candidatus Melainabacteria bacterium RIFOXYA12_FULL_32_12]